MNIGIICMATGVYERFWADFYESVDRYFCADAPKTFYLFTDSETLLAQTLPNVRAIRMDDRGWSTNILRRSELFLSIEDELRTHDYVFTLNVNFRAVIPVPCSALLPEAKHGHLTCLSFDHYRTRHPDTFSYERCPESRACIALGEGTHYVQGGFYGGRTAEFLSMGRTICQWTAADAAHGIVPVYHDESHLNRYMVGRSPRLVDSSYAWAEEWTEGWGAFPEGTKGVLLDKKRVLGDGRVELLKAVDESRALKVLCGTQAPQPVGIVHLSGGLGNQMFEYALMLGLRERFPNRLFYVDPSTLPLLECHESYQLDEVFGVPLSDIVPEGLMGPVAAVAQRYVCHIKEETYSKYQQITDQEQSFPLWRLWGYWQSERYFGNKVHEALRFDPRKLSAESLRVKQQIEGTVSVAVHVRRGDYANRIEAYTVMGGLCDRGYYRRAMASFGDEVHFFVFSDDQVWCRRYLDLERATLVEHNRGPESWQDMALMSYCDHQIVANSSFSWWAAWLNDNPNKRVVAPPQWYRNQPSYDIIPSGWELLLIEEPARRYDDLVIVIPVRIDSMERERNLERVLDQLEGYSGLKVVVLEADIVARWSPREGVRYVYVQDHHPLFHRTKYINILCSLSDTPYMGVWDTDVIVPRPQFDEALELLRQQKADMAYPYDGRFYNVNGLALANYLDTTDEAALFAFTQHSTPMWGHHSCGGAFLASRAAYVAAGGENEAFRGWGPEDLERYKRWEIQGYRLARVDGPIFHLDHPRGANSRYFDGELMRSTMQALLETCRRTK